MKKRIKLTILLMFIISQSCSNDKNLFNNNIKIDTNKVIVNPSTITTIETKNPVVIKEKKSVIDFSDTKKILLYTGKTDLLPLFNSNIDENGNGILIYGDKFRKISNYIISDKEDKLYKKQNNSLLDYVYDYKINLNNFGDGFISFKWPSVGICFDNVSYFSCGNNNNNRYYVKMKNYIPVSEPKLEIFDQIIIDNDGNGILYTYSDAIQEILPPTDPAINKRKIYNNISFKKITGFNISDKSETIESLNNLDQTYDPTQLILDSKGTGEYFYFDSDYLYIKKVNNFIPDKDYTNVGKFSNHYYLGINRSSHDSTLNTNNFDINGNGYFSFPIVDSNKTNIIPIKNSILQPEKSFMVDSANYPKKLDENGNGNNMYLEKNASDKYDLKIQDISSYNKIETRTIKNFPENVDIIYPKNNLLNFYLKNDKGFVIWSENKGNNTTEVYLKYISDFDFYK